MNVIYTGGLLKHVGVNIQLMQQANESSIAATGLVLMDLSLTVIAYDCGAIAIFNELYPDVAPAASLGIPPEILAFVGDGQLTYCAPLKRSIRIHERDYTFRAYLVDSLHKSAMRSIIALQLERNSTINIAMDEVASTYHLTEREQQVLIGLSSTGLTNKELAARMNISPNTVKLFVRLMMIKMGVTTRAGLVAKILQRQPFGVETTLEEAI